MLKSEYENMRNLDQSHWWFLGMTAVILGVINRYYKGRADLEILDAGSGTCWLAVPLMKYGNVSALDIEPGVLNVCQERGVNRTILGDIQKIPIESDSFDLIVCSEVLYHKYVSSDVSALREFYRILRPGGRVIIKVPAHAYLAGEHDKVNLTRERYEMEKVKKIVFDAGFVGDFFSYANFFLLPIVFLKRKSERILHLKPASDIQKTPVVLNWVLKSILRLEGALLSFVSLPGGSSIVAVGRKPR